VDLYHAPPILHSKGDATGSSHGTMLMTEVEVWQKHIIEPAILYDQLKEHALLLVTRSQPFRGDISDVLFSKFEQR